MQSSEAIPIFGCAAVVTGVGGPSGVAAMANAIRGRVPLPAHTSTNPVHESLCRSAAENLYHPETHYPVSGHASMELQSIHAALYAGLECGTLNPVVGQELPLADAAKAHTAILEPGAYGKIVLVP